MNEAQLFEIIGRKDVEIQRLNLEYNKLLSVLVGVKSGGINPEHITILSNGWQLDMPPIDGIHEALAARNGMPD